MSTFRKDHELVLNSLENMALTLAKSKMYDKARPILRGILRSQNSKLGPHHERSIETCGTLAFVLIREMEFDESVSLLKSVLKWQKMNAAVDASKRRLTENTIAMVENLTNGKVSLWV